MSTLSSLATRLACVALLLSQGCAPGAGRGGPLGVGDPAVPLAELRTHPDRFVGRTITTRGTIAAVGRSAGSPWIDLLDTSGGGRVLFLMSATAQAGALEEMTGKQIELMVSVDGTGSLEDGRPVVRASPLQIVVGIRRFDQPQEVSPEISEAMKASSEAMSAQRAKMFRDPGARTEEISATVRYLDPELRKPAFDRPGPARIERSGTPEAPQSLYTTTASAADGGRAEVTCRFRVEAGDLRSVSYEEVVRKPDGSVASRDLVDFLKGQGFDKVSGKSFPWPRNIYAAPCLPFSMRGFPVGKAAVVDFFLWSLYDPFSAMFAALDGREEVPAPGGPTTAVRVRMNLNDEKTLRSLDLPMAQTYDMAREMMAQMKPEDSLFWIGAEPPHDLLRFQGPTGPPGATRAVIDRSATPGAARPSREGGP